MHPMIKPALRRGWRDRQTVQYGVAPAHAVLVGPVDDATAGLLDLMKGARSLEQLDVAAVSMGLSAGTAEALARRLERAGVLEDATAHRAAAAQIHDRLRPDLASLSVVHPEPGGGLRRLAGRRAARIQVRGAGRVGSAVAATLSAAGVGQVDVVDGGVVAPWDTLPAGVPAEQVGERRDKATRQAVHRASPWPARGRQQQAPPQHGLSLVVFAPRDGVDAYAPDPAASEAFVRTGTPHLYGGVIEGTGVIGPLVLPGATACAECVLRRRTEREPTWPLMVGQWRTASRRHCGIPACDAALATTVAGATAAHALAFLDGDAECLAGYRQTLVLPGLRAETERFTPHAECPCGAAAAAGSPPGGDSSVESALEDAQGPGHAPRSLSEVTA